MPQNQRSTEAHKASSRHSRQTKVSDNTANVHATNPKHPLMRVQTPINASLEIPEPRGEEVSGRSLAYLGKVLPTGEHDRTYLDSLDSDHTHL